ncbi:MAG: cytochrome P450 [Saccharospirillaceae bacterium]|nr:cytochrome P450 [Pseudomonadales bacterium]NRB80179.1 cytochrome P450 [Saccharospirillaceae bacterium]
MKAYNEIPKDPWYQNWKHSIEFIADTTAFFDKQVQKHGNIFRCQLFGFDYMRAQDADVTAILYKNSQDMVSTQGGWQPVFDGLFPNGLLMKDGKSHIVHRRIMQQAFNKKAMLVYFDCIKTWSNELALDLEKKQTVDFFPYIKQKTLDLALSMFLGFDTKNKLSTQVAKAFVDVVGATISIVRKPILNNKYHRGVKGRAHLKSIFLTLVKQRRENSSEDLVSFLCEATDEGGLSFSDEQIVDHIIFTMMAAHDTTASSLTSLMIQITQHSKWQDALILEAKQFTNISYEQLSDMHVADIVYKETLRVMPPIVTVPRVINVETNIHGFKIPAGTRTGINIYGNHHDERYWDNPYQFDPTRFERTDEKRHPYSYIPFGGGVHKCIGLYLATMEVKLIIQAIFSRLDVQRVQPDALIKYAKVPIMHPKNKFELRFNKLKR